MKTYYEQGLEAVRELVKEQFERELHAISEILSRLNIPLTAKELLNFSGLSISEFTVKGKYRYFKLVGVRTGDKAGKVERWIVRKVDEEKERKRNLRRESKHIANLKATEENEVLLNWLVHYWTRAKALGKWLNEVWEFAEKGKLEELYQKAGRG